MDSTITNLLVPLFFVHITLGTAILAWWFLRHSSRTIKDFGLGMAGYSLGLAAWAILVIIKPEDLKPLILLGVIPFLLAHIFYAKAAYTDTASSKKNIMITFVWIGIIATFVLRTLFFKSNPYFSEDGLLFFGLHPTSIALYIAVISVSFLPAIRATVSKIKGVKTSSLMNATLTTLYVTSIILVSAQDGLLLLINGWVMGVALLVAWVTALRTKPDSAA